MSAPEQAIFALERFAWDAPDRLEVSGWFSGMPADARPTAPVLVVRGTDGTHRLPAVSMGASSLPEEGRHWEASFAWQEPPAPFDLAELDLGAGIVIELPEPRPETRAPGDQLLEITRPEAGGGAEQLRLEADLVATQEELRETGSALDQTREQLARAREDLEAEHARHTADAERFREGLARVRDSAERALVAEQGTAQRLELELRRAHGELALLRDQLTQHERAGKELEELRADLETTRRRGDEAHARLREAQRPVAEAHAEAEQMLRRMTAIANALDGGG
jgi:ketosteroid isomerase-like protein